MHNQLYTRREDLFSAIYIFKYSLRYCIRRLITYAVYIDERCTLSVKICFFFCIGKTFFNCGYIDEPHLSTVFTVNYGDILELAGIIAALLRP